MRGFCLVSDLWSICLILYGKIGKIFFENCSFSHRALPLEPASQSVGEKDNFRLKGLPVL